MGEMQEGISITDARDQGRQDRGRRTRQVENDKEEKKNFTKRRIQELLRNTSPWVEFRKTHKRREISQTCLRCPQRKDKANTDAQSRIDLHILPTPRLIPQIQRPNSTPPPRILTLPRPLLRTHRQPSRPRTSPSTRSAHPTTTIARPRHFRTKARTDLPLSCTSRAIRRSRRESDATA